MVLGVAPVFADTTGHKVQHVLRGLTAGLVQARFGGQALGGAKMTQEAKGRERAQRGRNSVGGQNPEAFVIIQP